MSKLPKAKSHYWLIAGQVVFSDGQNEGRQNFNTLITTPGAFVPQVSLSRAQMVLQMRLMNEVFGGQMPNTIKITDVFLMAVSHLGHMTQAQFIEGHAELMAQTEAANQDTTEQMKVEVAAHAEIVLETDAELPGA